MDIKNAVALVTGASSGIGAATARALSQAGARVVLLARREDRLQQLADELADAVAVRCDVTRPGEVASAVQRAIDEWGRVDVLVNNAGAGLTASVEDTQLDDFRALLELDLLAPLTMMQAVIPHMRQQGSGSIVNVSSGTVFSVVPLSGAYAASKEGLDMLTRTARVELQDDGIAVSLMYPSVTRSEFIDSSIAGREAAAQLVSDSGLEFQRPEQVADAIVALVRSGDERADLVPEEFGGTLKS